MPRILNLNIMSNPLNWLIVMTILWGAGLLTSVIATRAAQSREPEVDATGVL